MNLDCLPWVVALCAMAFISICVITVIIPPPDINISRSQYEEASTRWHAQGILEYEMIVDYGQSRGVLNGLWRLHVQSESGVDMIAEFREMTAKWVFTALPTT